VVISIDDGYLDTATLAAPVLDRFGYTATLFALSAGHAVNGQVSDKSLEDRPLIAPAALAELRGGAFEIGAHTRTHADLTAIPAAEAALEVGDSKRELERELGRPVTLFAYPFGRADAGVRELVRQAGFRAARGVTPGRNRPATDPYDLRWLEVRGTYSLARFAATLVFGELSR
jgi:peptidoglycan/xylan/chitin deacetylase (PgdA/CDA1 family)